MSIKTISQKPKPVMDIMEMEKEGYIEEWICYKCMEVSAKRLTVMLGENSDLVL